MAKFRFILRKNLKRLPKEPGVYCFKNENEILYIGKAANIRERVKNHFDQPTYKDYLFLDKVKKIGYIKTNSEIEALILEANLIKKIKPKFNVLWKDDKNYFFVEFTKEDFPRIFWTHQRKIEKTEKEYIGPFVDGKALKETLKLLRKAFPFRSCKKIPKKPCLWYQLKRCLGPCTITENMPDIREKLKKESKENAKKIKQIFEGKIFQVLKNLEKEMKKYTKNLEFEKAKKIRDEIFALQKVLSHKVIFETKQTDWGKIEKEFKKILKTKRRILKIEAYDISNLGGKEATGSMVVFYEGRERKDLYRRFKVKIEGKPNDVGMLKEVISRRLKHKEWPLSDIILIDGGKAQLNTALSVLKKVKIKPKVIALAKRKNELFLEGEKKSILLKDLPKEISNFLLKIRDEAHRFAISYHRKLRKKKIFGKIK